MLKFSYQVLATVLLFFVFAGCNDSDARQAQMPNPASVHCAESGGRLVIVEDASGQRGMCVFSGRSVCEEWDFYHGRCQKGQCRLNCHGGVWHDCKGLSLGTRCGG